MKYTVGLAKSHPTDSTEPCGKCSRINHTTAECCVGANKCMQYGSSDHSITACPRRLKVIEKGVARSLASPH